MTAREKAPQPADVARWVEIVGYSTPAKNSPAGVIIGVTSSVVGTVAFGRY